MSENAKLAVLTAGMVAALLLLSRRVQALPGAVLTHAQIKPLVTNTLVFHNFRSVPPIMLAAVIEIESARNSYAIRAEPHIRDFSVGLTQTLVRTAADMWDKGNRAFLRPAFENENYDADDIRRVTESPARVLFDPAASVYYGAAYLQWLANYPGGPHTEEWVIRAYNGGPVNGPKIDATYKHWIKYVDAKADLLDLYGGGGDPPVITIGGGGF